MNKKIDEFSLLHFIQFFILGLIIKDNYKLAFILSILWEIFEYYISTNETTKKYLREYWIVPERIWAEKPSNKFYDIFLNMLGYHLGNILGN